MLSLLGGFALFFVRYKRSVKEESDNGEYDLDLLNDFKKDTNPKIKKKRHALRVLRRVLSISLIVIISAFLVFGICDKLGLLKSGSKSIIVVASGSMSKKHQDNDYLVDEHLDDQFPTFAIIVIEKVDPNDLKQYDTIVYKDEHGKNIIHRIRRIEKSSSGIRFITRGDANNIDDTYKPTANDIQGRYTGKYVPLLGAFVLFVQSYYGIATMIVLIVGLILVDNTKNKIWTIHNERLNLLIQELSLDENNIQSLDDEDFKRLIENSNLANNDGQDKQSVEQDSLSSQNDGEINQNDINDNTNNG